MKADKLWIVILLAQDSSPVKTCVDSQLILSSSTLLQKLILQADSWESYAHYFLEGSRGVGKINQESRLHKSNLFTLVLSVNRNDLCQG